MVALVVRRSSMESNGLKVCWHPMSLAKLMKLTKKGLPHPPFARIYETRVHKLRGKVTATNNYETEAYRKAQICIKMFDGVSELPNSDATFAMDREGERRV